MMDSSSNPVQLQLLVAQLTARDWRKVAAAEQALFQAGAPGEAAVIAKMNDSNPVPRVRREAVHALGCQRCKSSPLTGDTVPLLLDRIANDDNDKVRAEAVFALSRQPRDARALPVLHSAHSSAASQSKGAL